MKVRALQALLVSAAIGTALASNPAMAGKPPKTGKPDHAQGHGKHERQDAQHDPDDDAAKHLRSSFFDTQRSAIIRNHYTQQFKAGHCPPGLAKKRNGCQPPGQAKKWQRGHRLPRDVHYEELPHHVIRELGHIHSDHRIVRIAEDILLIDAGTRMVIDALEDLGGL